MVVGYHHLRKPPYDIDDFISMIFTIISYHKPPGFKASPTEDARPPNTPELNSSQREGKQKTLEILRYKYTTWKVDGATLMYWFIMAS